ncbi:hypothetical protein IQ07DRAFT_518362 [Pyrenochaeta sp. DS3sAY3a]|nr:hypothetical protein IQ07DRAFT_518362 [Pyrenochaeta sp. DS3sAY3a]
MKPSPSPPQEAAHIRHQQLTPESPRPQNVPSPSNIPILVEQMDLNFHDAPNSHDSAATASQYPPQYPSQSQTPAALASTPYYTDQPSAANFQSLAAQGAGGGEAAAGFAQLSTFGASMGTQAQDTSAIQNYIAQQHQQSRAASASDASRPAGQEYTYPNDTAYAQQAPSQSAQAAFYQNNALAGATIDVQALLDSLTPVGNNAPPGQYAASQLPAQSQPSASASSLPNAASNLPPRPPAQDKLATHPNYNPNDDIRSFHPHSQKAPAAQQRGGSGQVPALTLPTQAHPGASQPGAQSPVTPGQGQRQPSHGEMADDEDSRWPPEINRKYEDFLDQERKFVTEGQWDQFPLGSRLFIGNLPTEKVTKRDIFHRFYRHGKLAQISIKQAYGFVQFLDSDSCRRALDAEQGQAVRGRKMHLEISKPQRNTKNKNEPQNNGARRRSRSPDYTRGGTGPAPRENRFAGSPLSPRDRDRRFRDRDDYRPMRSPSPRGPRGIRSRDRSRDRFDSRYRSRSRTPPRRHRSPSPRRGYTEDGLDLPRRLPHEVPDIQILVLTENVPRDFIRYVEDAFRSQHLRSNVLILSGRFPEPAVVRRQILEGVLAIVRLDTTGLSKGKVSVQIFDRRGGANNVQFNEYADLDPATAGALVNNAKQSQSQPVQPPAQSYGFPTQSLPPFSQPVTNPFPPAPASQPNVSNLITSLDPASLSQLLSAMSGSNLPQNPQPAPNPAFNAELARLFAQVPSPAQTPGFNGPAGAPLANLGNQFPGLASLLASQNQPAAPRVQTPTTQAGAAPDMNEIMAQLAQYQR